MMEHPVLHILSVPTAPSSLESRTLEASEDYRERQVRRAIRIYLFSRR